MMIKENYVFRVTNVENNIMYAQIVNTRQGMNCWDFLENGSGRLIFL